MANNNIGTVKCPLSGQLSVVRADKRQKLYYFSTFGKITPNLPQGQKWLSESATFWPEGIQPDNVHLETLYNGAPPVISISQSIEPKKALTPQVESKPEEKALTDEVVTESNEIKYEKKAKKRRSAIAILTEGWGEDDE